MGFSGNSSKSLKESKKQPGLFKNSTGTCIVDRVNGEAYSYNEVIARIDKKLGIWIINRHKFSVTTSAHLRLIEGKINTSDAVYIDVTTMNNFRSLKEVTGNCFCYCSRPELLTKKQVKEYTERAENNRLQELESRRSRARERRLEQVLSGSTPVQFKTYAKYILDLKKSNDGFQGMGWIAAGNIARHLLRNPDLAAYLVTGLGADDFKSLYGTLRFNHDYLASKLEDLFNLSQNAGQLLGEG